MTMIRNQDGSWESARSVGWQGSGPDYEVRREGNRHIWEAYDEDILIGKGSARTRGGLVVALWRHKRRWV